MRRILPILVATLCLAVSARANWGEGEESRRIEGDSRIIDASEPGSDASEEPAQAETAAPVEAATNAVTSSSPAQEPSQASAPPTPPSVPLPQPGTAASAPPGTSVSTVTEPTRLQEAAAATAAAMPTAPAPTRARGSVLDRAARSSRGGRFHMIGDQSPILSIRPPQVVRSAALPPLPPRLPVPGGPSVATVSRLKIAENQSPKPQDRVFYSFNYYANVNQHVNLKFDLPISGVKVYRHILGFEKTFLDGNGSFGVRFPIDTVTANPNFASSSPVRTDTSTAAGDLSFFGKFIVAENPDNGSLISVGLAVGTPNGPSRFGGAEYLASLHSTTIQPFVGYIWNRDRFYIHGFTAIDTAASDRLATLVYNDIGLGYFLFQSDEPDDWLTAVVPTFEVHINSPLTHGDWNNTNDPGAIPNIVNLTYGINFGFNRGSILTFALATPVTGPRPFDFEAMLLLNVFYGRTRRLSQGTMPILGP